jgi:TonB-dependent SusC/RagA subfamily outer membrane receptor
MARLIPQAWLVPFLLALSASGCSRNPFDSAARPAPERSPEDRATVTEDEIRDQPGKPLEEILAGRVSGVWVTRAPNGGLSIYIRGRNSIRSNAQPLYVIDGIPINPGPGGALAGINPYDIESIRVLKDAVATAEYGIRGANGVILIKLKGSQ